MEVHQFAHPNIKIWRLFFRTAMAPVRTLAWLSTLCNINGHNDMINFNHVLYFFDLLSNNSSRRLSVLCSTAFDYVLLRTNNSMLPCNDIISYNEVLIQGFLDTAGPFCNVSTYIMNTGAHRYRVICGATPAITATL